MRQGDGRGVIAAGDERTAEVGAGILRAGGNAVDAAVAASFAAFACEPVLTAPFGGGFANVAGCGQDAAVYDFFANAPGTGLPPADDQPELDFRVVEVDFGATTQTFHVGRGAAAVSTILPGLVTLQRDRGRLEFAEVMAPAIERARAGVEISAGVAGFVSILEPILRLTPNAERLFAPAGRVLTEGERFISPDLAGLLERVAGGDLDTARTALLENFGDPAGRLTAADLDAAAVVVRAPIRVPLGHCEVLLNPPPSSGGLLIGFSLRLLERVPARVWQDATQTALHLIAAMAIANAARSDGLDDALERGDDPKQIEDGFLSDDHVAEWQGAFDRAAKAGPRSSGDHQRDLGSTTHISVVDDDGLACAITSSNGEGCGHVVPGAGALCNNFMGEDDLHPHGFHKRTPGRRLTSMMCPTVVLHDGEPDVVLGTGGSNRIRTALLQVLVHHVLCGMPITEAVCAPRMHYEGNCLFFERRGPNSAMPPQLAQTLSGTVHETVIFETPNMFFGGVHAVDGQGHGAGDPRRAGAVRKA